MSPKDVEGMTNSVDPDQTAPLLLILSTLFAQDYLSKNLGSIQYSYFHKWKDKEQSFILR